MKPSFAGLLVALTLNALVSYEPADALLCLCHPSSCVLINANNSVMSTPEQYCIVNITDVKDVLILRYNETTLAVDVLTSYQNLRSIEIFHGSLQYIKPGAFEKLSNLTKLDVRGNNIGTLDDYTFRGLDALETLDLISNNLTTIGANAFDGLKSLIRLALAGNRIAQLPAKLFSPLPMVRSIVLNNNLLTELPVGIFDNIEHLVRLDVSNNRLQSFYFPNLKVILLFLHNNTLTSLYIDDYVKFVQANQNRIQAIMGTGLNVTDLVLADNALTDIRPIMRMTNLTKLSLSSNPLQSDVVFGSLLKLQELLLSNTSIQISEGTFANLSSMVLLDLSFNNLTQLDFRMFASMVELESLIVAYNRIEMINFIELREYLPTLRVLEVCANGWNSTYMKAMLSQMHRYQLRADVQGLSHSFLFSSVYVELCSAVSPTATKKASAEYGDYSMENVSDILEQEIAEYYPTTTQSPVQTVTAKLSQTFTTIKTTAAPVKEHTVEEPTVTIKMSTISALPTANDADPTDQQPVVGSSPLYITFQVLVYTFSVFGVVCLVVLGYYVRQRRFDVRRLTPVDSADSVRLM